MTGLRVSTMARLKEPSRAEMAGEQRRIAEKVSASFGGLAGPYAVWIREPELAERLFDVVDYLRTRAPLPARLRLLATLLAVRHWRAAYAWSVNAPLALKAGLPARAIQAIEKGQTPRFDDATEHAVYVLATELLETRALSDASYQKAVGAIGERFVWEVAIVLGYFSTVSLTVNAFDVRPARGKAPAFSKRAQ